MSKSNPNTEELLKKKFDYSGLNRVLGDMRKGFANVEKSNERMQKNMKSAHDQFYSKMMPAKK